MFQESEVVDPQYSGLGSALLWYAYVVIVPSVHNGISIQTVGLGGSVHLTGRWPRYARGRRGLIIKGPGSDSVGGRHGLARPIGHVHISSFSG